MLLTDIALCVEQAGLGTPGETLFAGEIPAHARNHVVAIIESPGASPDFVHDKNDRVVERPSVQVNVRDNEYQVARDKIEKIIKALTFRNRLINGVRYLSVLPASSPLPLPRDGNERHSFVCNFNVVKEPS
jgi:hypothetical protein